MRLTDYYAEASCTAVRANFITGELPIRTGLTTVGLAGSALGTGYGDVFPIHPVARSLCNLETIVRQLYPATLLARLVSLEIECRR
jgi:hypothetical protein